MKRPVNVLSRKAVGTREGRKRPLITNGDTQCRDDWRGRLEECFFSCQNQARRKEKMQMTTWDANSARLEQKRDAAGTGRDRRRAPNQS